MEDIKSLQILLRKFESLPKFEYEPTYLDICHYSGRRFEEICSRILSFYFQPKNEHGFNTLLIETLFELIDFEYKNIDRDITINLEENAEGKRLDILLKNKDWVIGIENKIGANVYNPLNQYKKRIEEYGKNNNFKILLTLHEIVSKEELKNINRNGFNKVLYTTFFDSLKNKLGQYISGNNMKYVMFLYDFIQTLENMKGDNIMNKELDVFFHDNSERLDELIKLYKNFKDRQNQKKIDKLFEIREKIIEATNDNKWKIYDYLDLWFSKNEHDIGIESWFIEEDNNPLAIFEIVLTSWTKKAWKQYGEQLKKLYPEAEYKLKGNRSFLYVYKINDQNDDEIIGKLVECYKHIINLKDQS